MSAVEPKPDKVEIPVTDVPELAKNVIAAKPKAPKKSTLLSITVRASAVGLPGFKPGIELPYFLSWLAISLGCILGTNEA